MDRFTRICGEMGIAAETIGTASTTAAMGPQVDDTLTNVLQSVEDVDMGLLFESRDQFGLGYRALTAWPTRPPPRRSATPPAILDPSLAPVYDDSPDQEQRHRHQLDRVHPAGHPDGRRDERS